MKRLFDLLVAASAIVLLLPLILGVALLVRIKLGAPVLFRQQRPGLNGEPFTILKFRTMSEALAENGELAADRERMTSLGARLRRYSLDELPQLFNVLRGDLSLVGPRPLLMEYLPLYSDEQMRRHSVRPGITGWAQVNGRNAISWDEKFAHDLWYVDHRSFSLDLKILWMTLARVARSRGVSQPGNVSMEKFTGNQPIETGRGNVED